MTYHNKLNGQEYKTLGGMCRTFRLLGYSTKEYYDKFEKLGTEGTCLECGKETPFKKFKYYKFCNTSCSTKYIGKTKIPYLDKLTEDQKNDFKLKQSKVSKKAWSDGSLHKKRILTIEMRYGVSYTDFKRDIFNKRLLKMSDDERKEFYDKATSASRKKSLKFKEYQLNGETILVQGYEPYVLDILKTQYKESLTAAGRGVGFIRYISSTGKVRRYFPDIIFDNNILIEVKSPYTLGTDKELVHKLKAAKDEGYIPLLCVVEPSQIEMFKNDLIETISSQAPNWCGGRFNDYPFIGVGYKHMVSEVLGIQIGS
jgi:hypothetical protein